MLVTPEGDLANKRLAYLAGGFVVVISVALTWLHPLFMLSSPLGVLLYWYLRRRTARRVDVMAAPFPDEWERGLQSHVAYFRALDGPQQDRFRNFVKVFLSEVPITGIRTEVDELTRVLVAASAVIPVFCFDDWEYSRLGEVLIYPNAFGSDYESEDGTDRNILGMVGTSHLSGVMILSKPDLIHGFANATDKRNVGIHEFAHLVDQADGSIDGIPADIPREITRSWIQWVGSELDRVADGKHHIDDYAYTNEAEYLAVLTEYFFESPELLEQKEPRLYRMMQSIYRQDTKSFLSRVFQRRPKRIGRNSKCPCGSGKKFKRCCRSRGK